MSKPMKLRSGTKVKAKVVIMSDDRANGLPCKSPVVPVGSIGYVIKECLPTKAMKMKQGIKKLYIVGFAAPGHDEDEDHTFYDVTADEIEIVD